MRNKIIWTTKNDPSAFLFPDWRIFFYEDEKSPEQSDVVYFRDPFNSPEYIPEESKLNKIIEYYENSKSIDNIRSFSDMKTIEDKYHQYLIFGSLMPKTWLPSENTFIEGENLAKPRISQRAKNILFTFDDKELDDSWIIQEILNIKEEIRVYVAEGKIIDTVSIKSSKQTGKVKVLDTRKITPSEKDFVKLAVKKVENLDFIGFDVAILEDGDMKIIEANRSPQFMRYFELTQKNIVKNFCAEKEIIGANTFIEIEGIKNIPAKIDTGADSSSVHAENISVSEDGTLTFEIFGKKISTKDFKVAIVRSSNGDEEIRYRAPLSVKIGKKKIKSFFSLSDRSKNIFPVLIGRKTIKNKFVVDVSKVEVEKKEHSRSLKLNSELRKNPFKFHQKYKKKENKR